MTDPVGDDDALIVNRAGEPSVTDDATRDTDSVGSGGSSSSSTVTEADEGLPTE